MSKQGGISMCHLRQMNAYEFEHYAEKAVHSYAAELVKSGSCSEDVSLKQAQKTYDSLLPKGLESEGQYLFHIINDTDAVIGMIWFGERPNHEGFIYDFSILEHFRNQGFGTKALELVEVEAKNKAIKKLSLHVFGHNINAIRLYKKMGYGILWEP